MRKQAIILTAALGLFAATAASAAELAGVKLADSVNVGGKNLVLNGLGLRKKFFIKIYVGGLYLPSKETNATAIMASDSARRQVMHLVYSVSKGQMCDAWEEGLEANTPHASAEVKGAFKTLCSLMEPVDKGHEIVTTYIPGTGTQVEVNGKMKGTLPGKATADAILATWIGPDPAPGADFKKAVLGQR
jgi:hypothetical protein